MNKNILNRNFFLFILITAISIGAIIVYAMNNVSDQNNSNDSQALGDTRIQPQDTNQADSQTVENFDINKQPTQPTQAQEEPSISSQQPESQTNNIQSAPVATPQPQVSEVNELKIEDVTVGSGNEVKSGDNVEVHYTGTFLDGEKFDSSHDRNQTFDFAVGAGQVIQGWDQGLIGMKVGGKRILLIPSDLAYGAAGAPGAIPPNTPLKFEIELISIN